MINSISTYFLHFKIPKHANWLYTLGAVLIFSFLLQIITGTALAIHYLPSIKNVFYLMNRIKKIYKYGWLVKSAHVAGASLLFTVMYFHIWKGVYYKAYLLSKKSIWLLGSLIYLLMLIIAFLGNVLPFGQISYWATVVITNFIESIPLIGKTLKLLFLGELIIGDTTLKRCFIFHCILPFIVLILIMLHLFLVHIKGQSNPIPNRIPVKKAFTEMNPVFVLKYIIAITYYISIMSTLCLIFPNILTKKDNYYPADYYRTPSNLTPEWYFLPFYTILKTFESKLISMVIVLLSLISITLLPYTHNNLPTTFLYKNYRYYTITTILSFILLGIMGKFNQTRMVTTISKFCITWYLGFFLISPFTKLYIFFLYKKPLTIE
ncbi:MAG: cytochrome bc complex cytochrome b subunit [Candidatus Hodgkinia cicadicola]